MEQKKTLVDLTVFLQRQYIAALATIKTGGIAHAASIYFHSDKDCNFYFLTKDHTQKNLNIIEDPRVALVIHDPESLQTVQVEGFAKEVDYAHEYAPVVKEFIAKLEKVGKKWDQIPLTHVTQGYFIFIKISPTWIRWSDFKDWNAIVQLEQNFEPTV